jgi:peptide/nickel transport system substrate-binding protein
MKQEYKMFLALLIMILFLILYMPTVPTPAQAALPNKITSGTWVWAPEGPPTPGGVYWNYWSPTNLVLGFWQYLPLAVYVHNDHQFIPILTTNWSWNGNELIVTLRHPYYWDTVNGAVPFTAWDVWTTYMIGIRSFGWFSNYGLYNINNYTVAFWFHGNYWKDLQRTEAVVLAAYIGAPYFQFGKYAEILATVNTPNPALSSYLSNLTDYIEKLNVTPTSNGFYFPNVSAMNDEYMIWVASPYFEKAFPNSSVRYYPEMITYWSSSNTQTYNFLEAGLLGYCVTAIPYSIYETLKSDGYLFYMADTYGGEGFYLNPEVYPFNNPLVRQALYYAINTSERAEAYAPDYVSGPTNCAGIPSGFLQESENIIPSSFFQHLNNYSYDPQKATQLLEEAGLKEINGQWYLPNGSTFTINIIAPSGFTDWVALSQEFATQLKAFGINAQVFELSTSDFYSEFFSGGRTFIEVS